MQWSRTILAILVEDDPGKIHVKLFQNSFKLKDFQCLIGQKKKGIFSNQGTLRVTGQAHHFSNPSEVLSLTYMYINFWKIRSKLKDLQ